MCDRTTTRDLRLNVNEDLGALGVVVGCLSGLARFVVCCDGLRTIYGGHRSDDETKSAKRNCCGCVHATPFGGPPSEVDLDVA